jgi:hypothetical protein
MRRGRQRGLELRASGRRALIDVLASLFSRDVLLQGAEGLERVLASGLRAMGLPRRPGESTNETLDRIYARVVRDYPAEYVFKNELLNRIFVARHNPEKSAVLTEMRVALNRVDLVIVNGTATAYEIKTQYDSLNRLVQQLDAYRRVFDKVYVVCSPDKVDSVQRLAPTEVGILSMGPLGAFSSVRNGLSDPTAINADAIIRCLRKAEYSDIVQRRFGHVPDVPNMQHRRVCADLIRRLSVTDLNIEFARILRERGQHHRDAEALAKLPYSLRHAYYQLPPTAREAARL